MSQIVKGVWLWVAFAAVEKILRGCKRFRKYCQTIRGTKMRDRFSYGTQNIVIGLPLVVLIFLIAIALFIAMMPELFDEWQKSQYDEVFSGFRGTYGI